MTRRLGWVIALWAVGCAGGEAETRRTPVGPAATEEATPVVGGGVTQEQNEAIDALFRRKAPQLQRCWVAEYEKTQDRKLEGDLMVSLTVTPSGRPTGVQVRESTISSPDVQACVVQEVSSWMFPEVSGPAPYRRVVHLGAQF